MTSAHSPLGPARTAVEVTLVALPLLVVMLGLGALPDWRSSRGVLQCGAWLAFALLAVALVRSRLWRLRGELACVLLVAAVLRAGVVARAPELSDDLWRYLWDGRVLAAGKNPYAFAPADSAVAALHDAAWMARINHPALRTIYPPVAEAGFALVHAVRPDVLGMKLWITLHDLLLCFVLARWARSRTGSVWPAIAYAWNPLVVIEYAGSGHLEPVALLPLALAFAWAERRPRASALLLVVATLTKLLPVLALPLLWRRWTRAARALALALCGAGLAGFALLARGPHSGLEAFARTWRNNDALFGPLAAVAGDGGARLVAAALTGAVLLWGWRRTGDVVPGAKAVFATALLGGPVVHPWYLGWMLVWEGVAPAAPVLLLSALALLNYGVLAPPAEGGAHHPSAVVRAFEYGAPAALALVLALRRRPT
ncbi:MAG: glycosyltransferase 87 family protein [Candidatus Eisenbacteria bacterium]